MSFDIVKIFFENKTRKMNFSAGEREYLYDLYIAELKKRTGLAKWTMEDSFNDALNEFFKSRNNRKKGGSLDG